VQGSGGIGKQNERCTKRTVDTHTQQHALAPTACKETVLGHPPTARRNRCSLWTRALAHFTRRYAWSEAIEAGRVEMRREETDQPHKQKCGTVACTGAATCCLRRQCKCKSARLDCVEGRLGQTRRIWSLLEKAMATQSGWYDDHCSWLISASALYARIGSSTGLGMCERSHIKAWESSPALQT